MNHYVIFVERRGGVLYTVGLGRPRRLGKNNTISYRGKSYVVDRGTPHHVHGRRIYHFVDILDGQLTLENQKINYDPSLLELIVKQSVVRQMLTSLGSSPGIDYIPLIIGAIVGVPIGIILGGYI